MSSMSDISNNLVFIQEEYNLFGWVMLITFLATILGLLIMLFTEDSPGFLARFIATAVSLVALVTICIMGVIFQSHANSKNAVLVQTWLLEEYSISLTEERVVNLLSEEGFKDFISSDPQGDTRVSGTFKHRDNEYFLVWKNEKLSLQKLEF